MPDIDHAGFHRGLRKSQESNMCHFPASTILLLTLCQWFRTLYNTQKAIQENQDLQSMHSQLFVVLLYPPAGSGCCRISCRYSLVLRKMPGIDGAGSQYKTNRRAPAVAGYPTGSPRCTGKLCQPAGFGRCRFACKLYICRINTRIYGCHIEPCTQYAGSSLYAGLTWSSGIRHELVPVGIMSVLYTTIEQAASTTHSEMATIAVQTSERAKRGMQKKGKSTP